MSILDIEKRVAALEREIAQLKTGQAQTVRSHPIQTLEQIHGTFQNDESFRQAMKLGRQWRRGTRRPSRKPKVDRA